MKTFKEFLNEQSNPLQFLGKTGSVVLKGQKVKVKLEMLQGAPESEVEAHNDSSFNEHFGTNVFSFLFGGDMMMFAKLGQDGKWKC